MFLKMLSRSSLQAADSDYDDDTERNGFSFTVQVNPAKKTVNHYWMYQPTWIKKLQ
jgi:hypothetical protein